MLSTSVAVGPRTARAHAHRAAGSARAIVLLLLNLDSQPVAVLGAASGQAGQVWQRR